MGAALAPDGDHVGLALAPDGDQVGLALAPDGDADLGGRGETRFAGAGAGEAGCCSSLALSASSCGLASLLDRLDALRCAEPTLRSHMGSSQLGSSVSVAREE